MAAKFKQVRDRIDALFHHRHELSAPVGPADNPFRPPGAFTEPGTVSGAADAIRRETIGDLALLQQAAATLRVGGIVEVGDRAHAVINGKPYKVGEVVPTLVSGETVPVRVRTISRNAITVALNEAEVALKFGVAPPR